MNYYKHNFFIVISPILFYLKLTKMKFNEINYNKDLNNLLLPISPILLFLKIKDKLINYLDF